MRKKLILIILIIFTCLVTYNPKSNRIYLENHSNINLINRKNSLSHSELEENEEIDSKEELKYKKKYKSYKNTNYISPALDAYQNSNTKDKYENNNSFNDAYQLIKFTKNKPQDFDLTVEALLTRDPWYYLAWRNYDEDYYQIDIQGNAYLDINLSNVPSACDYDMELYKESNSIDSNKKDVIRISNNNEGCSSKYGGDENINLSVEPGSYYIRIFTPIAKCDENNKYKLNIKCSYSYQSNESISDLRFNKGCKCAMWKSDYNPYGFTSNKGIGKYHVGYTFLLHNKYDYFNRYIYDLANDDYLWSEFYIWDNETCKALAIDLENINIKLKNMNLELDSKIQTLVSLNDYLNNIGTSTGIILEIISLVGYSNPVLTTFSFASTFVLPAASFFIQNAIPSNWQLTLGEFINYLENMISVLKVKGSSSDSNQVLTISKYYKAYTEFESHGRPPYYINNLKIYIKFNPQKILTMKDSIISYKDNYILGHIYGIRNQSDYLNACAGVPYSLDLVNTAEIIDFNENNVNNVTYNEILPGEYNWYKFTAPETAIYEISTSSHIDTYGEIFNSVVPGYLTSNRILFDDDGGDNNNFCIRYELKRNSIIYIRVKGYNNSSYGEYYLKIGQVNGSFDIFANDLKSLVSGSNCSRYYDDEVINKTIYTKSGESIITSRLRCCYIGRDNVVLSVNKQNIDTAFLRMTFDKPIKGINIDISLWSDSEYIDASNCSLELRCYNETENKFITCSDFFKEGISDNRKRPTTIYVSFSEDRTFTIEIMAKMKIPSNSSSNKGRVTIKKMKVFY